MNPQMSAEKQHEETLPAQASTMEKDLLAVWGFTSAEIISLLWLRQWYQRGGSDRAMVVRHLEFLRLLVRSGELEL